MAAFRVDGERPGVGTRNTVITLIGIYAVELAVALLDSDTLRRRIPFDSGARFALRAPLRRTELLLSGDGP